MIDKKKLKELRIWKKVNDEYCTKTKNSNTKQIAYYPSQRKLAKMLPTNELKEINTIKPETKFGLKKD